MKNKEKRVIALTFDDGPNTTTTRQILDIIEEYRIKASFFVVGRRINDKSAQMMNRAHSMGCEINSHSFSHSVMPQLSPAKIREELRRTEERIISAVGEPPRFFRPPYIVVSSAMYENIELPFIAGIGCDDWDKSVSVEERVSRITKECGDGSIILLHDSAGNTKTVRALRQIIPFYLDAGYSFLTVSELFRAKGIVPRSDKEIIYSRASENGFV